MTTGLAPALCNAVLKAIYQQTNFVAPTALWAKLHIGDPGADGTANPALNTTRVNVTAAFGTLAAGATSITNDALMGPWDNVPDAEDYTHISLWDDPDAGNFQLSGEITANAVAVGDSFDIPVGDFTSSFTPAA